MIDTPVIFIIFNRPDTTSRVFETIRAARPERLLVVADGPRADREGEAERCAAARAIVEEIDWPCEVQHNYSETNLGCRTRVASGITWAFEQVEEAIILEDDTLPHPSFFRYCSELLERYRDDQRIMCISGNNFQDGITRGAGSYYFSKYNHCWGWATWRRAWQHYDAQARRWPTYRNSADFQKMCGSEVERQYWTQIFDQVAAGQIDSWAYPWTCSVWQQGGLTVLPNINLVSNIGFGADATHTTDAQSRFADLPARDLGTIIHPPEIVRDGAADRYTFDRLFCPPINNNRRQTNLFSNIKHTVASIARDGSRPFRRIGGRARRRLKQWVLPTRTATDEDPWQSLHNLARFQPGKTTINNKEVAFVDSASCASAGKAIFADEIYRFSTTSPRPRILDCGANIGLAILYWKSLYPDSLITAFEPDPTIFRVLEKNVRSWGFEDVELVNSALGATTGIASFFHDGADAGSLVDNPRGSDESSSRDRVSVLVEPLSKWLTGSIDLLKVDIEGAEEEVFQEIQPFLSQVERVFVEWHSIADREQGLHSILANLHIAGFRVHLHPEWYMRSPFCNNSTSFGMDNRVNIFGMKPSA